jgi:peptidoglycan hydrolase CwlO-like protein
MSEQVKKYVFHFAPSVITGIILLVGSIAKNDVKFNHIEDELKEVKHKIECLDNRIFNLKKVIP